MHAAGPGRAGRLHDGGLALVVAAQLNGGDRLDVEPAALLLHDPRHGQPDEEVLELLAQQRLRRPRQSAALGGAAASPGSGPHARRLMARIARRLLPEQMGVGRTCSMTSVLNTTS